MMSLRFSAPSLATTTEEQLSEKHDGVITRICNYKYGFLRSEGHENIFFHFSELSDDAKATVEPGAKVTFHVKENAWTDDKKMKAIKIEVVSSPDDNAFKNLEGEIQSDMRSRGFTFINHDDTTYLFHSTNLVNDDASKAAGNTVTTGHRVVFDAEWNHKYNPPKPFATNVRIVPGQSELNAAAAALEFEPMSQANSGTWQRGSSLRGSMLSAGASLPGAISAEDADAEDDVRTSISPSGRPSLGARRGSVSDRASALKMNAPLRRWSRTTNTDGRKSTQSKPSGGLRLTVTTCKFGRKCTRKDCWFTHKNGRIIDDGRTSLTDTDDELCVPCGGSDSDTDMSKVTSMGKASLRLLVKAIAADTGKQGYLHVRNCLQRGDYVGRALTRDEKNAVGEILEELEGGSGSDSGSDGGSNKPPRAARRSSARLNRSSFTSGRVSLSDLCRDPSLHSRLSAANAVRS
jgi:cold shock CspA family protein